MSIHIYIHTHVRETPKSRVIKAQCSLYTSVYTSILIHIRTHTYVYRHVCVYIYIYNHTHTLPVLCYSSFPACNCFA